MPEEEPSFWRKNWKILESPRAPLVGVLKGPEKKMREVFSSVTNVRKTSKLKTAWRYTLEKHTTKWTLIMQHLKLRDTSWEALWASPPPLSWTPPGRSHLSTMMLCQSTGAPLTSALGINAPKWPKNKRGTGNKCWRSSTSSPRTLLSVNKVQTCLMSNELL